ncbi:acyl-CoA thioesterase-1 [Bradyrhizobium macuxiense]|uniref:Acyl-CoA thioesterase-1 n=1 Tax=Bradyrhizobium macuxiense TaxID=1755647 RepID=A0A560MC28_9BRAD|nr:GDSL-type esterase/lipase family protein [Bradyrhizobium macuxiense]TWC05166.1 acyl-CoA thioesterase-1 [Bradyrhizobium macuxiense]
MIYPARSLRIYGFLVALVLCLGSPARAQIVAIGASNVAGRGVSSSDAWPAQLEGMLAAKGRNVQVTNAGINGDTNAGMLARLDSAVPEGTRIVLLDRYGGGWNARRLGRGDQNAELAAIESKLRSRHIRVIPMWWNPVLRSYLQSDHIHFTPEGHRVVAAHMLPAVMGAVR